MTLKIFPRISIVTPSFNQAKYIEDTIISIISQGYPNLEYIIIDGGSTDESVDIIKKYEKHLKYWVCEPDMGQADAITKGLKHCTGDIFNWINSDDILAESALNYIATHFKPNTILAATVYNFYPDMKLNDTTTNKMLNFENFVDFKDIFHQPGIWFELDKIKSLSINYTRYHYCFDRYILLEYLILFEPKIIYSKQVVVNFRWHLESKTSLISNISKIELFNIYEDLINQYCGTKFYLLLKSSLYKNLAPYFFFHLIHKKQYSKAIALLYKYNKLVKYRLFFTLSKQYLLGQS